MSSCFVSRAIGPNQTVLNDVDRNVRQEIANETIERLLPEDIDYLISLIGSGVETRSSTTAAVAILRVREIVESIASQLKPEPGGFLYRDLGLLRISLDRVESFLTDGSSPYNQKDADVFAEFIELKFHQLRSRT